MNITQTIFILILALTLLTACSSNMTETSTTPPAVVPATDAAPTEAGPSPEDETETSPTFLPEEEPVQTEEQAVLSSFSQPVTSAGEPRVLYGHVFRNGMLIIIAGFPAAFVGILFTGAFLIEIIFSLDGLGLLGYEAAIKRDYPVMFASLYVFGLLGLIMQLISDLMYVAIDPRIDFESREA